MHSLRNKDGLDSFTKIDTKVAICFNARRSDDIFLYKISLILLRLKFILRGYRRYETHPRQHHHCMTVLGPSWSWLVVALSDMGEAPGSFSQKIE